MHRLGTVASIFIIWIATYSCYNNSLHGAWVFDDNFAVVNNKDILLSTPLQDLLIHDFWGQDISKPDSHKSYRPFTVFTFRLNYALHGMETYGYHLVNVVLHCVASTLVHALAHMVFADWWISLASGLFFGLHPIHTEAVSSIVGRAEVLCTVFYLLAIFAFQQARDHANGGWTRWLLHGAYIGCFILATLSKETGYTVLGVLLLQYLLLPPANNLKPIPGRKHSKLSSETSSTKAPREGRSNTFTLAQTGVVLVCCGLAYVLLRTWLTTTFTLHNFRNLENPIAFAPTRLARGLSCAHLHAQYLFLLLYPINLSADYSFNAIPIVDSIGDIRNLHTIMAYVGLLSALLFSTFGAYSRKQESGRILWLLLFGGLAFVPASNLFFYVGTMLAERLLYIPSIPFCIILAWGSVRTARAAHSLSTSLVLRFALLTTVLMCSSSMCGWYAWRTHTRNLDWQGERELFMSALEVCPGSAKVWQNIGILHRRSQNWTQALEAFAKARKIEPYYCELDYWDGITYLNMGKSHLALKALLSSVSCVYTQVQAVTALNKVYNVLLSSSPNNATYLQEWAHVLEIINRTQESSYYHLQASILLHNQGQHTASIEILLHVLSLLACNTPPSPTPLSMSKAEMACSAHMWLGAGYLASKNMTGAVEHLRLVAGLETPLSPLPQSPLFLDNSPLVCPSLFKQGRQALGGLYATLIQDGYALDSRSRFELAMTLVESGNIQAAHYQAYLVVTEIAAAGDLVDVCRILRHSLERTKQWESLPSYKQIDALYDSRCVSPNVPQKDEL